MLESVHVKNLALIDEAEVTFDKGLNILTGETGAGKSIVIGSINLALGSKSDASLIRTGAEYALAELVFRPQNESQINRIKQLDIALEDDGSIILSRKIYPGKSVCRIGGETVSQKQIKQLAEVLIDIHGQHEHQSLLSENKQLEILDAFAAAKDKKIGELKDECKNICSEYNKVREWIEDNALDESTRKREIDLARYEYSEITGAGLTVGEDEELENTYRKLQNARNIEESLGMAYSMVGDNDGALDKIGRAIREIRSVSAFDERLCGMEESLIQSEDILNDLSRSLSGYLSDLTYDEETFNNVYARLDEVNRLKSKYGGSIEAVLDYLDGLEKKVEELANFDETLKEKKEKLELLGRKHLEVCGKISQIRQAKGCELARLLTDALVDLNFLEVRFEVSITSGKELADSNGYDKVSFLISVNPGEAPRPLAQIASGGELSRIMLALKSVLASEDEVETLIFDEIDTGISGKTAWKVSEKMGQLAMGHQLICITHLPQIAAMADSHYLIEKQVLDGRTVTRVRMLSENESESELARMMGGEKITDVTIESARQMRQQAKEVKQG